jgi:hypothetical protein
MRGYLAMTAQEVADFLKTGTFDVSDIYAPTSQFMSDHPDLDEEEVEYTLSMVAAEDAVEMKSASTGATCVLALEIPDKAISESHVMSVSLATPLNWENVECLFEVSDDGEDLTWFATQEIEANLPRWMN